jgi:hypothetical protein
MKLSPGLEEIEVLRKSAPAGPILVINLLRFRPGDEAKAAYGRYLAKARPAGHPDCEVIHSGPAFHDFGAGEAWDYVIIARYPRFDDFASTVTNAAWIDAARERPDALDRTLMIVTSAGDPASAFGILNTETASQ